MTAVRFFKMLEVSRRLKNADRVDDCDIAGIATHVPDYQEKVTQRFLDAAAGPAAHDKDSEMAPLDPETEKNSVLSMFSAGGFGYVRK